MNLATAAMIGLLVGLGAFLLDNAMRPSQTCPAIQQPAYPAEAAVHLA